LWPISGALSKTHAGTAAVLVDELDAGGSRRIRRPHALRDLRTAFTLNDSNVVLALQVKPELGTISEIAAEPDGRIRRDRPASVEDVGDAARWYAEARSDRGTVPARENFWAFCQWVHREKSPSQRDVPQSFSISASATR